MPCGGALAAFGIGGALDALVNTAVLVGKLPLVLATMVTQSSKANAAFAENWDAFMGMVLAEKKPNAKIYVGDIYNSNAGLKFTSTSQFRVGQLLGFSTNEINNVIRNTSKYRSQYTVVHTAGVEQYLPETINKKDLEVYFPSAILQYVVKQPLNLLEVAEKYDIKANLDGGGFTGQSQALRLAIARALVKINEEDKKKLKDEGFLTRDSREVERKKPGQPKARRRFQFSKR